MNCPTCIKEMKKFKYFDVEIDRCVFCGGLWLDGSELSFFIKKGIIPPQLLSNYCIDTRKAKVKEGKRECPRCSDSTVLEVISHKGIHVDYCGKCSGFWFDKGELLKILEKYLEEINRQKRQAEKSSLVQEKDKDGKEIVKIIDFEIADDEENKDNDNPLYREMMTAGSKDKIADAIPPEYTKDNSIPLKDRIQEQRKKAGEQKNIKTGKARPIVLREEIIDINKTMESEKGRKSVVDIIIEFLKDLLASLGYRDNKE